FLSRACLQIVAHDRTCRRAASDFLEASARERRGCYKDIRRTLRCARVDRISLERRNPRTLCGLHGRGDKLSHDPLPPIVPADEKTGNRPDGQIVRTLEPPHATKPRERIAWRELAPSLLANCRRKRANPAGDRASRSFVTSLCFPRASRDR